jgi:predicted O-methyltransferase YrrM
MLALGALTGLAIVAYLLGLADVWFVGWLLAALLAAIGLVLLGEIRRSARRTDELVARVDLLDRRLSRAGKATAGKAGEERKAAKVRADERRELVSNISAAVTLHSLFDLRAPVPPPDKWAAMPDLQLHLVQLVLERKPALVVECGSGTSSVWLGYAAERVGGCRVVALEHHERFATATRALVKAHELDHVVDVRLAPLQTLTVNGAAAPWYDVSAWHDLEGIDMLLVDGPPAATAPQARYPAVPLLSTRLSATPLVVMDDANRPDEKSIVRRWVQDDAYPGARTWSVRRLPTARGTLLLEADPEKPTPTPGR